MSAVRALLREHGLIASAAKDALAFDGTDPWAVRAVATERLLSNRELAVALGHIARHRGFKSNAKNKANDPEGSKMKEAMEATRDKLAGRTFGQLIATDASFAGRKRNRDGEFSRTPLRADLEAEVRAIFREQRRRRHAAATEKLEADYLAAAFFQRGLQDSEVMLANCAFEAEEKRTSKRAYSFELFRFLSRLNTFTIVRGKQSRKLTAEDLSRATEVFGETQKFKFKDLRKALKLESDESFEGVRPGDEKNDCVARQGEAALGTWTLMKSLEGAAWDSLVKTPEKLDRIAEVISFREDLTNIRNGLEDIDLEALVLEKLMEDVKSDRFKEFKGAGHISSKACRNMIPHLAKGMTYDKAAKECGYDHTTSRERNAFDVGLTGKEALKRILSRGVIDRSLVGSPIARKALIEAVKQVKAVVEEFGVPDAIHVELARDVGKGIEERREIEAGIERRNKEKEKLREKFKEDIGVECRTPEDLLRYELWREQNGRCIYSDELISPHDILAGNNKVEVDHILPWSRFGDDSFNNKTLCTAKANREKKGRTPFEWLSADKGAGEWEAYLARVNDLKSAKGFKRRNYTLKDAKGSEEKFRSRNLNDTRWTSRLLAECLKQLYPKDTGARNVFTRPGALTDRLRRGWGLQWFKKDEKGERIPDDRHHALDAIICAATSEGMMQRLTRAFQIEEAKGSPRDFRALDQPWPAFRVDVLAAVENVFVSRAERRRARGEAHAATVRSVSQRDGVDVVFERKRVSDLKPADLDRSKDPERNAATVAALRAWFDAGKPEGSKPMSHKGDDIHKVTLRTTKKPDVLLRGGAVDRGEMARVDVFRKKNKKGEWQFYLVPIYPHQIAGEDTPPNRAIVANKPEAEWDVMDSSFEFLWSLSAMEYLVCRKKNGEVVEGYHRGTHRGTGAINVSHHANPKITVDGTGVKTLAEFRKYFIDRFGVRHEIIKEQRTWRGKVCT